MTLGVRWSRDQLDAEEDLFDYSESARVFGGDLPAEFLTSMNVAIGALAPDGTVLDYNQLRTDGVPASESLWRQMHRKDDESRGESTSTGPPTTRISFTCP